MKRNAPGSSRKKYAPIDGPETSQQSQASKRPKPKVSPRGSSVIGGAARRGMAAGMTGLMPGAAFARSKTGM